MAYRLEAGAPLGRELVRIVRKQAEAGGRAAIDRRRHSQRHRIHKARTCCKKARAALRLLGRSDPKLVKATNAYFREAGRKLSEIRDAQVLGHTLDRLLAGGRRAAAAAATPLRRALRAHQRRVIGSAQAVETVLNDFAFQMQVAGERLRRRKPKSLDLGSLEVGLSHAYRRGHEAFRRACGSDLSADFHAWRKASKIVGFHCRLLPGALPPFDRALRSFWDALSDVLGEEHDLAVLEDFAGGIKSAPKGAAARLVRRLAAPRRQALRQGARAAGSLLFREKPKAWSRRLVQRWRTGRASPK